MTKTADAEADQRTADVLTRMDENANRIEELIADIRGDIVAIRREREALSADD